MTDPLTNALALMMAYGRMVTEASNPLMRFNPLMSLAPHRLDQPILPGWNLGHIYNITESNSSSPATEAAILKEHSYGRQIGWILDAVEVLIDERNKHNPTHNPKLDAVKKLNKDVNKVKIDEAVQRIEGIRKYLDILKDSDPAKYALVVARLKAVL